MLDVPIRNPRFPCVFHQLLLYAFWQAFCVLASLPNFALDRLSRYEATLWRQSRQILLALDALDRRKPQERTRFSVDNVHL
jgi:hypothetical protein